MPAIHGQLPRGAASFQPESDSMTILALDRASLAALVGRDKAASAPQSLRRCRLPPGPQPRFERSSAFDFSGRLGAAALAVQPLREQVVTEWREVTARGNLDTVFTLDRRDFSIYRIGVRRDNALKIIPETN